jgi:hypothetical protein
VARLIDEYAIEALDERVLAEACEFGASPRDLEFISSRTTPDWSEVVKAAARGGHLHVFRWMTERQDGRGPWQTDFISAFAEAACYGHLEIVKWVHVRRLNRIGRLAFVDAARHGHLEVLKWLNEHSDEYIASGISDGMDCAAASGHLATVQWLYEKFKDTVNLARAMEGAATKGHLDVLQWLHQQLLADGLKLFVKELFRRSA